MNKCQNNYCQITDKNIGSPVLYYTPFLVK